MADRPYILLSCGMSIDGYLDNASSKRLLLSNEADLERVDAVRAASDAILVGAQTVRQDNPRLLVRSAACRDERVARGLPPTPAKVTVTAGARLDPRARFFATGQTDKLVYCARPAVREARERLGEVATVVDGGPQVRMRRLVEDLHDRGTRRLMVEGGGSIHTQFLTAGLADELPPRRGALLRRRLAGPAVRRGRPVPLEPGPSRHPRRGPPPRRRRAPPLRTLGPLRGLMTPFPPATIRTQVADPAALLRRLRHHRPRVHLRRPGRRRRAPGAPAGRAPPGDLRRAARWSGCTASA